MGFLHYWKNACAICLSAAASFFWTGSYSGWTLRRTSDSLEPSKVLARVYKYKRHYQDDHHIYMDTPYYMEVSPLYLALVQLCKNAEAGLHWQNMFPIYDVGDYYSWAEDFDIDNDDRLIVSAHLLLAVVLEKALIHAENLPSNVPFIIVDLPSIYLKACEEPSDAILATRKSGILSMVNRNHLGALIQSLPASPSVSKLLGDWPICPLICDDYDWYLSDNWTVFKDILRHRAAMIIQSQFRKSISDPKMKICRSRLTREFGEIESRQRPRAKK